MFRDARHRTQGFFVRSRDNWLSAEPVVAAVFSNDKRITPGAQGRLSRNISTPLFIYLFFLIAGINSWHQIKQLIFLVGKNYIKKKKRINHFKSNHL